jgi:hypothetical protein
VQPPKTKLRSRVTCPHCWHEFSPEDVLWISAHSDLLGDPLLGQDAQQRFLPTRFNPDGKAIDVKGVACKDLACPHCHLSIFWASLQMNPLFISILGAPGSGKSNLLAAMTWKFREALYDKFSLSFGDADPLSNQVLSDYEEKLFRNPNDEELVALDKTALEGDLYQSVQYGDRSVWYPRPFVFSIQPLKEHPDYERQRLLSRALCLYDNAGEHFLPGRETAGSPMKHLALSEALLFLFDPTQHSKFRRACQDSSSDPQLHENRWAHQQHQVLAEVAARIRSHTGWPQDAKYPKPLIIVVTKFDAWCSLMGGHRISLDEIIRPVSSEMSALYLKPLQKVSKKLRDVLREYAPEIVTAAEGFCDDVTYIPASALGRGPEINPATGAFGIRPRDIDPMWAEVPLLYALHRTTDRLVYSAVPKEGASDARSKANNRDQHTTEPPSRNLRETGS